MPNNEGPLSGKNTVPNLERHLSKHKGLRETLAAWCKNNGDYENIGPLSLDAIVVLLVADTEARKAAMNFLSYGGHGWEDDPEAAESLRERIAWALVDKYEAERAARPKQ
jgi:hypothetical protein